MAVYYNLKGTTQDQFQIGKKGPTLYKGTNTPGGVDGDFWFDTTGELKVKVSGVWELIHFDNLSISGNSIVSTNTNGDISITPDGTGDVILGTTGGSASTLIAPDNVDVIIEGGLATTGNPGADLYLRGGDGTAGTGVDGDVYVDVGNFILSNSLTLDSVALSAVQTSAEGFVDNDTSIMTSAAIDDRILSYNYSTTDGTVTSVSVVTANGVSGSVATATTTPAITLTLGDITPTSVGAITSANLVDKSATETISGTWTFSETIGGSIDGNAATATTATTATNANNINVADTISASTFVVVVDTATGNQAPLTDGGLTYNAATSNLAATTFTGALSGNATTASAWETTRTIGMSGDVSSDAVNIDGSGNITITNTVVANDSHTHNANNLTGTELASNVVTSSLTSVGTLTALQVDNININGSTISSTNLNGNILITPNGTGDIILDNTISVDGGSMTGITTLGFDSVSLTALQTSGEAFVDNDTSIMTSAAIDDRILSYGYSTTDGTVTSVGTNTGLSGTVTTSGNLSLALQDLADGVDAIDGTVDEIIYLDNGTQKRKQVNEWNLGQFNNDQGWTSNAGTVTSVSGTGTVSGLTLTGTVTTSGNLTLGGAITGFDNYVSWNVQANGGTQVAVSSGEEVNFINGTYTTASVVNQTNPTVTFNHNNTTRSDTTSGESPSHGGTFDVVSSVSSNTQGHITAIDVKTVTLPADNNDNYYLTGLGFDTGTGILTATVSGAANPTVDLDGRYVDLSTAQTAAGIKTWSDNAVFDTSTAGGPGSGIKIGEFELFPFTSTATQDDDPTFRSAVLNGSTTFRVMGNGTGLAAFEFFGTDWYTVGANWENFKIQSGTTKYVLQTDAAGTGTVRPLSIYAGDTNVDQLLLNTDGTINIGDDLNVGGNLIVGDDTLTTDGFFGLEANIADSPALRFSSTALLYYDRTDLEFRMGVTSDDFVLGSDSLVLDLASVTHTDVGSPTFAIKTSAVTSQDALLQIGGARTASSASDIAKIDFLNIGNIRAAITMYDPAGASSSNDGGLKFRTYDNTAPIDALTLVANGEATFSNKANATSFEATGLGANSDPGTDDAYFGGYGLLGSRATFYISNAAGPVVLNHTGVHGANTKLATSATGITVTGNVSATQIGGITQANLLDKSATESVSGAWDYTGSSIGSSRGLNGRYSNVSGTTAFGAQIWTIDSSSWDAPASGNTWTPGSMYGIAWLRGANASARSAIGEGLYTYVNGGFDSGMGASGIETVGNVLAAGYVRANGNVYAANTGLTTDDQFYMGAVNTSTPAIYFDSTDYLEYNRGSNLFSFDIGGAARFVVSDISTTHYKPMLMQEQSAPRSHVAGYGQLWVKNTTPCKLVYQDDTDVDYTIETLFEKDITIENPADADDITWFYTNRAITVQELIGVIDAGTSAVLVVRHSTDRSLTGTEVDSITVSSTTTGTSITSGFTDATIPINSWVWIEVGTVTGAVTQVTLHLEARIDA